MDKHRTSSYCVFCNEYIGNKDKCPKCGTVKAKKSTVGRTKAISTKRIR